MKKKILLTGGSGYIGFQVLKELSNKYSVIVIDKKKIKKNNLNYIFYKTDFANKKVLNKIFKKNNIYVAIHLAAFTNVTESQNKKKKYFKNNYFKSINFLEICKKNKVKNIIFSSSSAVYGNNKIGKKIKENNKLKPMSIYATTKKKVEDYLKSDSYFNFYILRFFNVVGYNETLSTKVLAKNSSIFGNLVNALFSNRILKIYGNKFNTNDGTAVRDFISIQDIGKIVSISVKSFYFKKKKIRLIVNCGTGLGNSILEILKKTQINFKKKIKYKFMKHRDGEISFMVSDNKLLKKKLGFKYYKSIDNIINSYKKLF